MSLTVLNIDEERGVVTIGDKKYPAKGLPGRDFPYGTQILKTMRYYNSNKKKDEIVTVDLAMGEQRMIRHWDMSGDGAKPVYSWFKYAVNKGWICKEYLMEPENEFGPVSP